MNLGEILLSFTFSTHQTRSKHLSEMNSSELRSFYVTIFILSLWNICYISFRLNHLNANILILASTGGLLSLFLGFSAVSMVEIFYFIALRSYCSRRTNQDNLEMQEHNSKSAYKSKVARSRLTTQNQIWPYTRTHGRTHLDGYANHETVAYRRKY